MSDNPPLELFSYFPAIAKLGMPELQRLCDSWRSTASAREFAISKLAVNDERGVTFQVQLTHDVKDGEEYFFPAERLLIYIADNGITDVSERDQVKEQIRAARRAGADVFQKFRINTGPKLPLFVTCPHCGKVLQTQFTAYRAARIDFAPEEIDCPACGRAFTIDGDSLHFER